MPPLALASMVQNALPWLSPEGRAVVNTLVCDNGRIGSIHTLCERIGLRSRYQLGRLLQREGLPPYEELAGWICVLHWMLRADAGVGRGRLRSLAGFSRTSIATSYRLVRRVTGQCWKDLRSAGTAEVMRLFQERTHPPKPTRRPVVWHDEMPNRTVVVRASPHVVNGTELPQRLPLSGRPFGIAMRDRDLAYITRAHAAAVECLDLRAGQFVRSIPVGCTPSCVTFDASGERAYASIQHLDEISVIDARNHRQVTTWHVPYDPFALVLTPSGRTLFVTTNEDRLLALSTKNGRIIGSLPLPATSHHIALHPAGDRLYVATRTAGVVLEVDAMRLVVQRSFAVGGWPQGLVVSSDGATLYAANEHHGLDVIRLANGRTIARLEEESGAVSLGLSPDQRFLYTGLVHMGAIGITDVTSLSRQAQFETGGRPRQLAFDPSGEGRVIIVNEGGWVDILPLGTRSIARTHHPTKEPKPAALGS